MTLEISSRKKLERKGVYKPKLVKVIFYVRGTKLVNQGCLEYFSVI